jgi:hypothetical protein
MRKNTNYQISMDPAIMVANYMRSFVTGVIPVPSQHTGNCASDTIQMIMFFADVFSEYFVLNLAVHCVRTNTLPPTDTFVSTYLHHSIARFINLYSAPDRAAYSAVPIPVLSRSPSRNASPNVPCHGELCSMCIGSSIRGVAVARANIQSWAYLAADYNPRTLAILNASLPPLPPPRYIASLENQGYMVIHPERIRQCVAIQVLLFNPENNFHKYCFFRKTGADGVQRIYIGDNMAGLAILAVGVTMEMVCLSLLEYRIVVVPGGSILQYNIVPPGMAPITISTPPILSSIGAYPGIFRENSFMRLYYLADPIPPAGGTRKTKAKRKRKLSRRVK